MNEHNLFYYRSVAFQISIPYESSPKQQKFETKYFEFEIYLLYFFKWEREKGENAVL